ncbi:hypothetical protein D6C13_01760 [Rahnella woolbedingensis]|uniref:Uncharacterized protein n=1 Tax=Rahnella woolbedingensis TaxID=1510574 RepID=A0A419NEF0_9GAMM|nr:hypothetical protein D6C13_01760 [Rahnella woolbedingensis]
MLYRCFSDKRKDNKNPHARVFLRLSFMDLVCGNHSEMTAAPERAGKRAKKCPHRGGQKYFL